MNRDTVIALPVRANHTPEQAVLSALEFVRKDNLKDVLVIGYDGDGVLLVCSSPMTRAKGLFMVEKVRKWMAEGGLE